MSSFALALCLAVATTSAPAEDEMNLGELHVSMSSDYASVIVNGEKWEQVEFEDRGKKALVKYLRLDEGPIVVRLEPSYSHLEPHELTVTRGDFRRVRKGREYYMIASRRVTFKESKEAKPTPRPAPEEPKPAPEPKPDDGDL